MSNNTTTGTCMICQGSLNVNEGLKPIVGNASEQHQLMCSDCYQKNYENECPICGEYFLTPKDASEVYLVFPLEGESEHKILPGIYQGIQYPIWDIKKQKGTHFCKDNVKLINPCDINEILEREIREVWKVDEEDFICPKCFDKYQHTDIVSKHKITVTETMLYERGFLKKEGDQILYSCPEKGIPWKKPHEFTKDDKEKLEDYFLSVSRTFKIEISQYDHFNEVPTFFAQQICFTWWAHQAPSQYFPIPINFTPLHKLEFENYLKAVQAGNPAYKTQLIIKEQPNPIKGDTLFLHKGNKDDPENLFGKSHVTSTQNIQISFEEPGNMTSLQILIDGKPLQKLVWPLLFLNEGIGEQDFTRYYFELTCQGEHCFAGKIVHFSGLRY